MGGCTGHLVTFTMLTGDGVEIELAKAKKQEAVVLVKIGRHHAVEVEGDIIF